VLVVAVCGYACVVASTLLCCCMLGVLHAVEGPTGCAPT
jgi:hypothetical protein